jgi:hypothetical protein
VKVRTTDVKVGDRLLAPTGELEVTRIDDSLMGNPDYIAFVEDSDRQWLKLPAPRDGEVELAG